MNLQKSMYTTITVVVADLHLDIDYYQIMAAGCKVKIFTRPLGHKLELLRY